jgi:DNA modification methylase
VREDQPPAPPAKPITKAGDLILLGEHRLICGDATDPAVLALLLNGEGVELLLTDPPYKVDYEGGTGLKIDNDDMSASDFDTFLDAAFCALAPHVLPGGAAYVFHADTNGHQFRRAFIDAGLDLKQVLVWVKQRFVLGRQDHQWQHEPILYGWKPGAAHRWYGKFDKTTVIDQGLPADASDEDVLAWARDLLAETTAIREDRPAASPDHPTSKPVRLCARLMANSSRVGDVVLDPFGGSGSTLMAAEHLNRKAHLIELDPRYCDVVVNRWQEATGLQAVRP